MKFLLFIIFSAVALTIFGIVSHSKESAQEARRYMEQRKLELRSKYDNSDFWPNSTINMVVTYPKKILVANTPPPQPTPQFERQLPRVYPTERKITAKDYRKDYVVSATKWVNGVEVPNDNKVAEEIQNEIRTLFTL